MSTPESKDVGYAPARDMDTERLARADQVARRRATPDDGKISQRHAYTPPMPRAWFMRTKEYQAYILRESAAVLMGLFTLNLMLGMVLINIGPENWEWWIDFQRNPVVLVLNVLALVAAVIQTVTWDQLVPSIIKVQRGTKFLADGWIIGAGVLLLVIFTALLVAWVGGWL